MLRSILSTMSSCRVRTGLRACYGRMGRAIRAEREKQIRRVPLTEKHMRNCELVLNRSVMLSRLNNFGCVAEIGVNKGQFSEQILKITKPNLLHLIDVWSSGRYHDGLYEQVSGRFRKQCEMGTVRIHRKLSLDAAPEFQDRYFDWIYIDTDHGYETTRAELIAYAEKVKLDGIIAGHDYTMGGWVKSYRYGVIEAVHEFCVEFDWELVFLTVEPLENQSFAIRRMQG